MPNTHATILVIQAHDVEVSSHGTAVAVEALQDGVYLTDNPQCVTFSEFSVAEY